MTATAVIDPVPSGEAVEPAVDPSLSGAARRPLTELVTLIKDDLTHAEQAGMPYYLAAGRKLLEAKEQLPHGAFEPWVKQNLPVSVRQARRYMELAGHASTQSGSALPFSSLRGFTRQVVNPNYQRRREPAERAIPVDIAEMSASDGKERAREKELARRLITAGYKVVARRLRNTTRAEAAAAAEDVKRLGRVRDLLLATVKSV